MTKQLALSDVCVSYGDVMAARDVDNVSYLNPGFPPLELGLSFLW